MTPLVLSDLESARFGVRVARWQPESPDARVDPTAFDVVIVRRPAQWSERWFELAGYDGYTAVHADSLIYWEWRVAPIPDPGTVIDLAPSDGDLAGLIGEVFADYQNHYRANPLFDAGDALDGYVEWAVATATRTGRYHVWNGADGAPAGVAVVDWAASVPDIRLAGMRPSAQGGGLYRHLLSGVMSRAAEAGHSSVLISTQVQNIAVQRVWAALGWKPCDAFDTTHLIRTELLHAAVTATPAG